MQGTAEKGMTVDCWVGLAYSIQCWVRGPNIAIVGQIQNLSTSTKIGPDTVWIVIVDLVKIAALDLLV